MYLSNHPFITFAYKVFINYPEPPSNESNQQHIITPRFLEHVSTSPHLPPPTLHVYIASPPLAYHVHTNAYVEEEALLSLCVTQMHIFKRTRTEKYEILFTPFIADIVIVHSIF